MAVGQQKPNIDLRLLKISTSLTDMQMVHLNILLFP